jgi:polysaccharide biosynthesis protein PslH
MKRLLYITHRVPYPPDKGDRIRTYHILKSLAEHYTVDLLALADEPVPATTTKVLEELAGEVAIVPLPNTFRRTRLAWSILSGRSASLTAFHAPQVQTILHDWMQTRHYDLLLTSSSSVAPYFEPYLDKTPVLVDLVDVDSEKWFNYAEKAPIHKSWIYRREATALRQYECAIARKAHATIFVSEAETELFRSFAPEGRLETVTNGVDLEYFADQSPVPSSKKCVFVGALDYHPNVDSVRWFADTVWPLVVKQHPEAVFSIVGRKPVASVQALNQRAGIEVIGQVPDVRPYVEAARVVVAPLRIARGLQNKVLEAMALSRPILSSAAALAGLTSNQPSPAIAVETPEQWATALGEMFTNLPRCQELGHAGRKYVENQYSWQASLEPLHRLIAEVKQTGVKQLQRQQELALS